MVQTNGHGGSAGSKGRSPAEEALARRKTALRRRAKEIRATAHSRLANHASHAIIDIFTQSIPLPVLSVVSGYMPIADELDPLPLMGSLATRGLTCAVPVVVGPHQPLVFREWHPGLVMEKTGPYGIPEPGADAFEVRPTVLLVPVLAFDRAGRRMGYGGGFYDRTLAAYRDDAPVLAVGLAYAAQQVDEVPSGPLDQRLDWVVTEREALCCAPAGGFSGPDAAPDDFLRP